MRIWLARASLPGFFCSLSDLHARVPDRRCVQRPVSRGSLTGGHAMFDSDLVQILRVISTHRVGWWSGYACGTCCFTVLRKIVDKYLHLCFLCLAGIRGRGYIVGISGLLASAVSTIPRFIISFANLTKPFITVTDAIRICGSFSYFRYIQFFKRASKVSFGFET